VALIDDDYDLAFGGFMGLITPHAHVDSRFLYYALTGDSFQEKLASLASGTNINNLKFKDIANFPVALPSLEEQRRIVAVLDEAFGAIATATANAEKNLANARDCLTAEATALLQSQEGEWIEKTLGSVCEMYQPQTIGRKDMVDSGKYAVFGANGLIGRYDKFNHEEPQLLVTCRGATCGSINMSDPFSWITGNAMVVRPKNGNLQLGLLRAIFEHAFDFSKVITGAAQPQITRQSLAPAKIRFPRSLEQQRRIEEALVEVAEYVDALIACYEKKLVALNDLKQSLLHRAFAGELTEREPLAA
jgi:restriction endonuclease S subunit